MSTEDKATRRKPTKKLVRKKGRKGGVTRVLLVLFALLYFPALWNWLFHDSIETGILDNGLLELKVPVTGVFIREETAVKAPRDGIIIPKVGSIERVPNQYEFAMLIDETSRITLQKINELEENIIRQVAESYPSSLEQHTEFREQVQNEADKLSVLAVNKTLPELKGIQSTLERLLYQRNREVFQGQGDRLYLQNEKSELEKLKQNLNQNATMIRSEFSGLVVWDDLPVDEKYSLENMDSLTPDDLALPNTEKTKNGDTSISKLSLIRAEEAFAVKKDQTFARLVSNEKSWFVCTADNKKAARIKAGNSLSLKLEGLEQLIPGTVESVRPAGNTTIITVAFNRLIEKTVNLRQAQADLVIESIEGLKIPVRSLTNRNTRDNTADVILVRMNRAVIKRVAVIAEQDAFAVIEALEGSSETDPVSIFDIYVVNPKNIEEGQVIK